MVFHFELTDEISSIVYVSRGGQGGWNITAYVYDENNDDDDFVGEYSSLFLGYDCLPDAIYAAVGKALPENVYVEFLWDIVISDKGFNGDCGCEEH